MKSKNERLERIQRAFNRLKEEGIELRHVTRSEIKEGVVEMIEGGKRKYGKKYFRPSIDTMVILLAQRQRIETSMRTVCRAIRELVDEHAVWRQNRHKRGSGIKMLCRTTAYYILDKGREMFRKMLRRAQRFLYPLGAPKMASDKVPQEHLLSSSVVLGGVLKDIWTIEGRASPLLGPSGS